MAVLHVDARDAHVVHGLDEVLWRVEPPAVRLPYDGRARHRREWFFGAATGGHQQERRDREAGLSMFHSSSSRGWPLGIVPSRGVARLCPDRIAATRSALNPAAEDRSSLRRGFAEEHRLDFKRT